MSITRAKKSTEYLLRSMAEVSKIPVETILESLVMAHLGQEDESHRKYLQTIKDGQAAPGYWRLKVAEARENVIFVPQSYKDFAQAEAFKLGVTEEELTGVLIELTQLEPDTAEPALEPGQLPQLMHTIQEHEPYAGYFEEKFSALEGKTNEVYDEEGDATTK